jgi:ATP-dependent helicase/nuclease subunit A
MSIHHSKGLEFPVCIICGISKQFNRNDEREKLIISDDMGVAFKLRDLDSLTSSDSGTGMVSYDTPFRNALKEAESGHLLAEQKRVFYVGITRAKDRLILMLKKPDEPELAEYYTKSISYSLSYIERANGFYDWIYGTVCAYDKASVLYENTGICRERLFTDEKNCFTVTKANTDFSYSSKKKEVAVSDRSIDMIADEIKQRLEYKYPYRALSAIRSKISITDIKNGKFLIDDSVFDAKNVSLEKPMFLSSVGYTSAEAGTAMHCFMQYADFLRCENDILAEARRLVESGYITGEQMDMLDIAKLESFFKSDLYSEIRNAKRVFRESAFTLNLPVCELYESDDKAFDGETLLVQGKIDCYFEDINGGYRIIDFKTDKVTDASILADRYMLQLLYYKKAVKEITLSDNVSAVIYSFHTGETVEIK